MKKIGYLGPPGTFSQAAAVKYTGGIAELICYSSLSGVMAAVEAGEVHEGVVPLENSTEGSVVQTLDLLAHRYHIKIRGEIVLSVAHQLLARPGVVLESISRIMSHPQALAQCRGFLEKYLPGVELVETASTAEAAMLVAASDLPWGSVGNGKAARSHGLEVIRQNIQDCPENATRFAVLGRDDRPQGPDSKTSLIVTAAHRPGSLYAVLREFTLREINLTRIESRPAKKSLGDYLFFIDLEGHRMQPEVREAINKVRSRAVDVKVLGSYPADPAGQKAPPGKMTGGEALAELRAEIDMVDAQIVDLLGIRTRLVAKVAEFKQTPDLVRDPAREEEVIVKVKQMALAKGADPELVEEVYRLLMDHFVLMQKERLTNTFNG